MDEEIFSCVCLGISEFNPRRVVSSRGMLKGRTLLLNNSFSSLYFGHPSKTCFVSSFSEHPWGQSGLVLMSILLMWLLSLWWPLLRWNKADWIFLFWQRAMGKTQALVLFQLPDYSNFFQFFVWWCLYGLFLFGFGILRHPFCLVGLFRHFRGRCVEYWLQDCQQYRSLWFLSGMVSTLM